MSRHAGHNGAKVAELESAENICFGLKRVQQDTELVRLRVSQAIRRGGPRDLLEPAIDLLNEIDETIARIRAQA